MDTIKEQKNYTLRVYKNGKVVKSIQTHSKRRFTTQLRTINWQNSPLGIYLRVSYGKNKCNYGCICTFYNDGWYEKEDDLINVFKAFDEDE